MAPLFGMAHPQQEAPAEQQQEQTPQQFSNLPRMPFDFGDNEKDDLTRYQLDISQTKADISHWLNGDTPVYDQKTNKQTGWDINKDDDMRVLNKFGIKEVMRIMNMYLTKDVIMSNLREEKINQISNTIANEINDLFFMKHDEIGLDTKSKQKNYSTIVITLANIIYITLMRAEGGKERQSATENRQVGETRVTHIEEQPQSRGLFGKRR